MRKNRGSRTIAPAERERAHLAAGSRSVLRPSKVSMRKVCAAGATRAATLLAPMRRCLI